MIYFSQFHNLSNQYTYNLNFMKIQTKEKSMPKKQNYYCCLYHYVTGKQSKAGTHCYTHVPLGIINPLSTVKKRKAADNKLQIQGIKLKGNPLQAKEHLHYLNDIQHEGSLPKRLVYPRIYVEQINKRFSYDNQNKALSTYAAFNKTNNFQEIYDMFKKFANISRLNNAKDLKLRILQFVVQNRIKIDSNNDSKDNLPQVLFTKQQFINFMIENMLSEEEALNFWEIACNQHRFNFTIRSINNLALEANMVSMRAFLYNFKKFYLDDLEGFKNCFSQNALRQRLIDLRLYLQPWFSRNIILKCNMIAWKEEELNFCNFLKKSANQEQYIAFLTMIEERNKLWFYLRTIAKSFYDLTDKKNIGIDVINERITDLIEQKKEGLQTFIEFIEAYKQSRFRQNPQYEKEQFKITDLIEYMNSTFPFNSKFIISFIRGIFKYLYFYKKQPLLMINRDNLKLEAKGIVSISMKLLNEYISFKKKEIDDFMVIIQQVGDQINDQVERQPQLSGHKKYLVQCNYVAESLLKLIKRCHFQHFYKLYQSKSLFQNQQTSNIKEIKSILEKENINIPSSFWNQYFSFEKQDQDEIMEEQIIPKTNYKQALQSYKKLSQNIKNYQNGSQQEQKENKENEDNLDAILKKDFPVKDNHCVCSAVPTNLMFQDTCSSSDVSTSISRVQSMSDYLLNLLKGN